MSTIRPTNLDPGNSPESESSAKKHTVTGQSLNLHPYTYVAKGCLVWLQWDGMHLIPGVGSHRVWEKNFES